jgi:hypothetical protein
VLRGLVVGKPWVRRVSPWRCRAQAGDMNMNNSLIKRAVVSAFVLTLNSAIASHAQAAPPTEECPTPRSPYAISTACARAMSEEAVRNLDLAATKAEPVVVISCPTPFGPYWISAACAHELSDLAMKGTGSR